MTTLLAVLAVANFAALLLVLHRCGIRLTLWRPRGTVEPVDVVEHRLLTVTSELERATLELKETVAEMAGDERAVLRAVEHAPAG